MKKPLQIPTRDQDHFTKFYRNLISAGWQTFDFDREGVTFFKDKVIPGVPFYVQLYRPGFGDVYVEEFYR